MTMADRGERDGIERTGACRGLPPVAVSSPRIRRGTMRSVDVRCPGFVTESPWRRRPARCLLFASHACRGSVRERPSARMRHARRTRCRRGCRAQVAAHVSAMRRRCRGRAGVGNASRGPCERRRASREQEARAHEDRVERGRVEGAPSLRLRELRQEPHRLDLRGADDERPDGQRLPRLRSARGCGPASRRGGAHRPARRGRRRSASSRLPSRKSVWTFTASASKPTRRMYSL